MKFLCTFCNVFVYDETLGDDSTQLKAGTKLVDIPEEWRCPVCGQLKSYLKEISEEEFTEKKHKYDQLFPPKEDTLKEKDLMYYRNRAREILAGICAVNKVCDGHPDRLCMGQKYGQPIGFGGAGQGATFDRNFLTLAKYRLKTRIVKRHQEPEMETSFLGKNIVMPVLVTSISGVRLSMKNAMSEVEFQRGMIEGAKLFGTIGLSGNTVDEPNHPGVEIIQENEGWGIPVFKPQSQERLLKLFERAEKANVIAIGVDLDGCGSTNWAYRGKPVYRKSEEELKELVNATSKPVIFKGVMSTEDTAGVVDSGAKAIDISNHGGRVIDYGQGVAEVLPEIVEEYKGKITIMADGAVRTGYDALKLLALGADVVLIGRPLARMNLAGGSRAIKMYLDYVKNDFRRAMLMTGCDSLKEITRDILIS